MEIWYRADRFKRVSGNQITTMVAFPAESPWFDGHFPQEPILPGIAQIAAVHDLLRRALGDDLAVKEVSRVRFKRKIDPRDRLDVTITIGDDAIGPHRFRLTCATELACSGFLKVGFEKEKE